MSVPYPQFTCPKCGGHYFGSAFPGGFGALGYGYGYCHGDEDRPPCGYKWERTDENDKAVGVWIDVSKARTGEAMS